MSDQYNISETGINGDQMQLPPEQQRRFAPATAEARGDASNFRGTDYHLLYALWLLLKTNVQGVHFFAGNDLRAAPISPFHPDTQESLSTSAAAVAGELDHWIQLKCCADPWTPSRLLDDNLLENFLCNSFLSDSQARSWRAVLITTADIRGPQIAEFAANPSAKARLDQKLHAIIATTAKTLDSTWPELAPTLETVRERARTILTEIAGCEPLPLRAMRAELLEELAYRTKDRTTARSLLQQLIGAMLQDASAETSAVRRYDRQWVIDLTGHNFWSNRPLDASVADACDEQVRQQIPHKFVLGAFTPRKSISTLLDEFLKADAPVFILTGRSGTGKSWAMANWAIKSMQQKARLLIPGLLFNEHSSIPQLISNELRHLTADVLGDEVLCDRVVRPSQSNSIGPLTLLLDDVRPVFNRRGEFARNIAHLVDYARRHRIKLIFACQSDIWTGMRPFAGLRDTDVFTAGPRTKSADGVTSQPSASCTLDDFSDAELAHEIERRFSPEKAQRILLRIRDPRFAQLRHPYTLDAILDDSEGALESATRLRADVIPTLFDRQIDSFIDASSRISCAEPNQVRSVLNLCANLLWQWRNEPGTRADLRTKVELQFGRAGGEILEALWEVGVLAFAPDRFRDPKIAARLFAHHLRANLGNARFEQMLQAETDNDVIAQLCTLSTQPANTANTIVRSNSRWIPAVAEGLSSCNPADPRIYPLLIALARRDRGHAAADALGRFALSSRSAWMQLVRLYLSIHNSDRRLGEEALWGISRLAPDLVVRAARLRVRNRGLSPPKNEPKGGLRSRRELARALRILSSIDSEYASRHVLELLDSITPLALEKTEQGSGLVQLDVLLRDPLLEEFDQIRTLAAAYGNPELLNQLLAKLFSANDCDRVRSVNGLQLVSRILPTHVTSKVCDAIRSERDPRLISKLVWNSFYVGALAPDDLLRAIEANVETCWQTYESAAATFSILESLSVHSASRVLALLPGSRDDWTPTLSFLLKEFDRTCRLRCERGALSRQQMNADGATTSGIVEPDDANAVYRLRGDAVALVLSIGQQLDLTGSPLFTRFELRDCNQDFFLVEASDWIKGNEEHIASHRQAPQLVEKLVAVAHAHNKRPPDVRDRWTTTAQYYLVQDCLDILVAILAFDANPLPLIQSLPRDWEALYVCRKLFGRGIAADDLVEFAVDECEAHRLSATAQASGERTECLIELAKIAPTRVPDVLADSQGLGHFFSGGTSDARRFADQIDQQPNLAVERLETFLETPSNLSLCSEWNSLATQWLTVLLSAAYSRMFVRRTIRAKEAKELANTMCIALEGCSDSEAVQEHREVYHAILKRLSGEAVSPLQIRASSTPIAQSHRLASEILQISNGQAQVKAILELIADSRGWVEHFGLRWEVDGRIGFGMGVDHYLLSFFPAVRLALCAIGQSCDWRDPGFTWLQERQRATLLSMRINSELPGTDTSRIRARAKLEEALKSLPDQERILATWGHLLIVEGDLITARTALEKALASPLCQRKERGTVHYNLACTFAREGREDDCKRHLHHANDLEGLNVEVAKGDLDLESVKTAPWFIELISGGG